MGHNLRFVRASVLLGWLCTHVEHRRRTEPRVGAAWYVSIPLSSPVFHHEELTPEWISIARDGGSQPSTISLPAPHAGHLRSSAARYSVLNVIAGSAPLPSSPRIVSNDFFRQGLAIMPNLDESWRQNVLEEASDVFPLWRA